MLASPPICVGVPLRFAWCPVLNGGGGVCRGAPCLVWILSSHIVLLPSCITPPFVCLLSQHCGMAVVCFSVRVVSLWNGGGAGRGLVAVFLFSPFSFSFSFFVLVFGVVRAQPCEHARYPRTPLCSLVAFSSLLFSPLPVFLRARLSSIGIAVGDSPRVGVLRWHDSNRESVSFVLVFLIVACSAFASSSVAASAVAFGAEDSPVVRVVGSA